jgi:ribosomal-protein-alanine N-acetyltransferase
MQRNPIGQTMTNPPDGLVPSLELLHIREEMRDPLADFFLELRNGGDDAFFHPHPLTREEATKIATSTGKDLYYALVLNKSVIAYGMLRGWDDGFEIPSLGIAVAREWRGVGVGSAMMNMLHLAARSRGARKIRLKVHVENRSAIDLYKSLGYEFLDREGEQLVGFITL